MKQIGIILAFVETVSVLFSSMAASEELPLALHINVHTRWGETAFLQGTPISIGVNLVNAQVRQAQDDAIQSWREETERAVKEGRQLPEYQENVVSPDMMVQVGGNNIEWFSKVHLECNRVKPTREKVLQQTRWNELLTFPENVINEPIVLAKNPIWVTLEITPEMSEQMPPGEYQLTVSYPEARPDTSTFSIKTAETHEDKATLNYELAEYALRLGDYEKAIEHAEQALGILPIDHDMLYLTLGDAFLGKGELDKAVESYERFLNTYEGSEKWNYPYIVRQIVEELKRKIRAEKEENR